MHNSTDTLVAVEEAQIASMATAVLAVKMVEVAVEVISLVQEAKEQMGLVAVAEVVPMDSPQRQLVAEAVVE
jgi:hypothetical protein